MSQTPAPSSSKNPFQADAVAVVERLRGAGNVAYLAGGCVRDLLLGRAPKDWDVATDAPPATVRDLFSNTQAVGAAFGVVLVRYRGTQIEVATFRAEGKYLDGRHPSEVRFTSAEEDARRRDFTINGLFLDPLKDAPLEARVIDYVGGRADLAARVIRAIGVPDERFEEDHLRMLRAVRFAARLDFSIEPATALAIQRRAPHLARISPERIADELRVMLPAPTRGDAWRLLGALELAPILFRFIELPPGEPDESRPWDGFFSGLAPGRTVAFALALATATLQYAWWALPIGRDLRMLLERPMVQHLAQALRRSLRISNEEFDDVTGTLEGLAPLLRAEPPSIATLKRFLARPTASHARELLGALEKLLDAGRVTWLQDRLAELQQTDYAPPPFITGDDLAAAGLRPGPVFKRLLDAVYDAQLEGQVSAREEAMALAMALAKRS